jgi:hypothetical protein
MRKQFSFVLLLLVCVNPLWAQGNLFKYPLFEQVVKEFMVTYDSEELDEDYTYSFAKKRDGWHVELTEKGGVTEDYLFWKLSNGKYKKLNLPKQRNKKKAKQASDYYPENWKSVHYNVCPYYGYTGWEYDVVADYSTQKNLPDSFVYGVGRAYSTMASNLLNNNSGFADSSKTFKLKMGRNALNSEQLATYRKYRHEAIAWFTKAGQMNPKLQTLVGEIGVKTANEFVCSFLDLRIYQNEEEAMKELPDTLYSEVYLNAAKNYLMSCSPNAVLLTNGDNDTYPLIYLQVKKGYRRDVLVVNASLLNTERYVNSLRTKVLDAKPLKLSMSYADIENDKRSILLIDSDNESYVDLYSWIQYALTDSNSQKNSGKTYYNGPSQYITFPAGKDTINWYFPTHYMYLGQLAYLDEIANEFGKRPIYFTVTLNNESMMGLEGYFSLEGMSYRLTGKICEDENSSGIGCVATDSLYANLMQRHLYNSYDKDIHIHRMLVSNYRNLFRRLAETLVHQNKLDSAKVVLQKCINLFPNAMVPFDYDMLGMIEYSYKSGDMDLGDSIAFAIVENIGLNKPQTDLDEATKGVNSNIFQYLKELAHDYKREKLMDLLL